MLLQYNYFINTYNCNRLNSNIAAISSLLNNNTSTSFLSRIIIKSPQNYNSKYSITINIYPDQVLVHLYEGFLSLCLLWAFPPISIA